MRRLLIFLFLLGILSPVAANSGYWVYMASGDNGMRRREVGITKKECFKLKREEQKKAKKNKYKLSFNKCFSTKLGVLAPVAANAGHWVYMASGENEMRRREVGITKKECFKLKREEQKKAKKNKYKLSFNKCFSTK